ncbi:MAG: hypothetical protein OXH92_15755 [Bryobacterales bacterium]|nr:hypothetical protein [Bryobacterales bacterium]
MDRALFLSATLGWAGMAGERDAIRIVCKVITSMAAGTTLVDALSNSDDETAARLLGPPAATNVVPDGQGDSAAVNGIRWRWVAGGWQPVSMPMYVFRRFLGDSAESLPPMRPVPMSIKPENEPFALFDAWPAYERTPTGNAWPAFLTTRQDEVRERAVRTRRKPGGGKRREPLGACRRACQIASFTPRVTKHGFSGSPAVRHFFWSEPSLTKCFSRDTNHGLFSCASAVGW